MKREFEIKVLNIEPGSTVAKLQELGGKIVFGPSLLKTVFFDHPRLKLREAGIPLRVRAIGEKAFLNVKRATQTEPGNQKLKELTEVEVGVEDFAAVCELLKAAGYYPFRYQEKKRTSFSFPGVKIELDQYPAVPAYLEFEGETAAATEGLITKLGYRPEQTVKFSATEILKKYGVANPDLVRFDDSQPLPEYLTLTKPSTIADADRKFEEVLWERD